MAINMAPARISKGTNIASETYVGEIVDRRAKDEPDVGCIVGFYKKAACYCKICKFFGILFIIIYE